tara:strand:+ start:470 stop:3172 length:2703 start_codon:yes stop_codon:yes gene_type:complete
VSKVVETLQEALENEEFLVAAIRSRKAVRELLMEAFGPDGKNMVSNYYESITSDNLKNAMMKIPEMVSTTEDKKNTALYLANGDVNPAFGLTGEAPDTAAIFDLMTKIFDGEKFGLKGMNRVNEDAKNELKAEIRDSLRRVSGATVGEARKKSIQSILNNYQVQYTRGEKYQKAVYDDIIVRDVYKVRARKGLSSEVFKEDEKRLREQLKGDVNRAAFQEFFDMFNRTELGKDSQVTAFKDMMLDTVNLTFDLGKAKRRGEIYDFWEKYEKETNSQWKKLVQMFSKGSDVIKLVNDLEEIASEEEEKVAKDIREMEEAFLDTVDILQEDEMPIGKFEPKLFSTNPSMVGFNVVSDFFKVLQEDADVKYGTEFTQTVSTDVGQGDEGDTTFAAVYEQDPKTQAQLGRQMEAIVEERGELSVGLDAVENLRKVEVDPIFYHLASTRMDFKNLAVTRKQARMVERKLIRLKRKLSGNIDNYDMDDSDLEGLLDKMEQIMEDAADEDREEYVLPLSEGVLDKFGNNNQKKSRKEIREFCDRLMKAVKIGRQTIKEFTETVIDDETRSSGPDPKIAGKLATGKKIESEFAGTKQQPSPYLQENASDTYRRINDTFTEMLKLIDATLIEPFDAVYMPFEPKNPFFTRNDVKVLKADIQAIIKESKGIRMSPDDFITDRLAEGDTLLTKKSIEELNKFLSEITSVGTRDAKTLLKRANDLYDEINNVFDDEFDDLNKIYIGKYLENLAERNDLDIKEFQGESVAELSEQYESMKTTKWPVPQLIKLVRDKEEMFLRMDYFKSDIEQLQKLLERVDANIRKTDIELAFLHAHDVIRKKLNKQIYYAHGDIDDPDDIDAINKMVYEKHRVDLSASEIIKIDRDFGAFKDIGKENGVSEEVVYMIKANFR